MAFLLRVELPDVPGSLGRVASAIGEAGGDIQAIEIVEHTRDGNAVDDVLLDIPTGVMPDSLVSACSALDGVRVLWISRYAAGGNLFLDLEAVEALTAEPAAALDRLVDLLPITFRADWGARVRATTAADSAASAGEVVHATEAAPETIPFHAIERAERVEGSGEVDVVAAAPLANGEIAVFGRRGGPEVLDSELARLGHLAALAVTISAS